MNKPTAPIKTALITGAGRGIGAATAVALAQRGIQCILAVRDPERAAQTVRAVQQHVPCSVVRCDVSDYASVKSAARHVMNANARLDIIVNNAAQIDPIGLVADVDPQQWAQAMMVNLVGPFNVFHAFFPLLSASQTPTVVNISTGAAYSSLEGWSAYCTSKAGLVMLTASLHHEYAKHGIAVYGLQPGMVDTQMQARIRSSGVGPISRVPRAHLASPDQPAAAIAWLADQRPASFRGQDLSVSDPSLHRAMQQHP